MKHVFLVTVMGLEPTLCIEVGHENIIQHFVMLVQFGENGS